MPMAMQASANSSNILTPKDSKDKILIVYIAGLVPTIDNERGQEGLFLIRKSIKRSYPEIKHLMIDIEASMFISLEKQGKIIHDQLENYFNGNNNMRNCKIIFIGYCTGALAAYEMYDKNKFKYNFVGIISAGTPWSGVNVLEKKFDELSWFFNLTFGLPIFIFSKTPSSRIRLFRPTCH